jgi:hypothetical protein
MFFFIIDKKAKKLVCLSLLKPFKRNLMFANMAKDSIKGTTFLGHSSGTAHTV